jgi:Cu/Ag efflux protein CusF
MSRCTPNSRRALAACAVVVFSIAGCGPATPGPVPAATGAPDQTYTSRAIIERLPQGPHALALHHEPIREFVGKDGKVQGMPEMVMDFWHLSPEATAAIASMKEGDAVRFSFEVRWNAEPRARVTSIAPLPAGEPRPFAGSK